MTDTTTHGWTTEELGRVSDYVRSYYLGQKKREMEELRRRIGDRPLWLRTFLTPHAGVPYKRMDDIRTGLATLQEDSVRVARHLFEPQNWTMYARRVGSLRGWAIRETVEQAALAGPGALYVLLVTDLLWVAWERHDPRMEAAISTVYAKIGEDNQLLWNRSEFASLLQALSRVKPGS